MYESTVSKVLMQITDGHPASAAAAARVRTESMRLDSRERVVLDALLRHASEKSLKSRVLDQN
jgi:hypothetical protein